MSGIFAIYAFDEVWKIAKILYYGILSLNHRGQSESGMAIGPQLRFMISGGDVEKSYNVEELVDLEGWYGIGWVNSPVVSKKNYTTINVDGKKFSIISYTPIRDIEDRLYNCLKYCMEDISKGLEYLNKLCIEIRRPITFVAINDNEEMYVYRDVSGLKPLQIGSYGFDLALISSESCALECVGGDYRCDISPGCLIKIDKYGIDRVESGNISRVCALEFIYYSRLDSIVEGVSIYRFRRELAKILAEKYRFDNIDIVVGIPETGIVYASEFSKFANIEFSIGFVQTGRRVRSALIEDILERLIGVQLKMSPIRYVLSGKNILLIDDSLLKGVTLRSIVQYLRNRVGVGHIHALIMSPMIVRSCPYYMEIPPENELICANISKSELADVLGLDSIHFADLEDLYRAFENVGIDRERICTYCMGGRLAW